MTAIMGAWARGFWRDRPGMALTLLLPPLVYLLFAAIFGAGARGEVDSSVVLHDSTGGANGSAVVQALDRELGDRLRVLGDPEAVERAVMDGAADVGVLVRAGPDDRAVVEIVSAAGRDVAAAALQARLGVLAGRPAATGSGASIREVGPAGDVQAAYYAGAVSVMFVFFAAMHGAMSGLDERRSGLQARLALACRGLAPIVTGRVGWLTTVGVLQSAVVFAAASPRLPGLEAWQAGAAAVTALLVGFAAAGLAVALTGLCRSREQAQPLTTFVVLLLAALGGSMAPRFLMPSEFRQIGWATPHAWAIEAYQGVVWRGEMTTLVVTAWGVLAGMGLIGTAVGVILETRRSAR